MGTTLLSLLFHLVSRSKNLLLYMWITYNNVMIPDKKTVSDITVKMITYVSIDNELLFKSGNKEGLIDGDNEGLTDGDKEGLTDGDNEGLTDGDNEGLIDGDNEGLIDGDKEGLIDGDNEGLQVGLINCEYVVVGDLNGDVVGVLNGDRDGDTVG